jgi:glucose/arabinose dehydrogenase
MPNLEFHDLWTSRIIIATLALAFSFSFIGVIIAVAPNRVESSVQKNQVSNQLNISLEPFATNLNDPVGIANAGDNRIFVLERDGIIRIVRPDGTVKSTPFLSITTSVDSSHIEKGLLGLAFDPGYTTNGYFYVNYTSPIKTSDDGDSGHTRISRFQVTNDPDVADPNSEEILLTVGQPYGNHNAGGIRFGPDGYLYIPLGDGGKGGDPENRAQTMTTLLGKISRIDVGPGTSKGSLRGKQSDCFGSGTGKYTIPDDNPFANGPGGPCDEIWALGLRNPWQSSFDRLTGDFFIGDVGQNEWEEIDHQSASSNGGENYGWRCYEGNHPYNTTNCGSASSYTRPIFEYSHNSGDGCAVVGGFVYRGNKYLEMRGHYLLADNCTEYMWDLIPGCNHDWAWIRHDTEEPGGYSAFGEGSDGELYLANRINGTIYSITEDTGAPPNPLNSSVYLPVIIGNACD